MVTAIPVQNVEQAPTSADYVPSPQRIADFDSNHTKGVMKDFLLRQYIKKEIRDNDRKDIVSGVSIVDLQTDQTIIGNAEDTQQFAAGVNMLPVTMLLMEDLRAGTTTLDTELTWEASDRRDGSGKYDHPDAPRTATVREVLHDLLTRSGNTAVRVLVNKVLGGSEAVNTRLTSVAELPNTRLKTVDPDRFYLGFSTAKESLFVLQKIVATDDEYTTLVKEYMAANIFESYGVKSQLAGNDYIVLVNKAGQVNDWEGKNARHDVGIIYNTKTDKSYGYSFMMTSPMAERATRQAEGSLKDMGKYTLRFAGDSQKWRPHDGKDKHDRKDDKSNKVETNEATPRAEEKVLY